MNTPLIEIRDETAWAACTLDGYPCNFINTGSVRATRTEAQAYIGDAWRLEHETIAQGWKRAYRSGWRCIKVKVSAL